MKKNLFLMTLRLSLAFITLTFFSYSSLVIAKDYNIGSYFNGRVLKENKAEIRVLEAPIFKNPQKTAPVIFYARKGDHINIHPAEFFNYSEKARKEIRKIQKKNKFLYLPKKSYSFFRVLLPSSQVGWVLKSHVQLITSDRREKDPNGHNPNSRDETDYLPEEDIFDGYPLIQKSNTIGEFDFAVGPSRFYHNAYKQNKISRDQSYAQAFGFSFFKPVEFDEKKRLYFGAIFTFFRNDSSYKFQSFEAKENYMSIAIGPALRYDLWKNKKLVISSTCSIQYHFLSELEIDSFTEDSSYKSLYKSSYITPRVGLSVTQHHFLGALSLILGANAFYHSRRTYDFASADKSPFLKSEFNSNETLRLNYSLGLQGQY